jgi:glycosyltransferase involved in cell wall biosynthesis
MKVLLFNRNHDKWIGGDQIQVDRLLEGLHKKGIEAEYKYEDCNVDDYDIIHLHNVSLSGVIKLEIEARRKNKPIVLSAVFQKDGFIQVDSRTQGLAMTTADKVIFNSQAEYSQAKEQVGYGGANYEIIRYGCDKSFKSNNLKRTGIICVGRIEERKNQLNLVKAVKDKTVYLVGEIANMDYFKRIQEFKNAVFVGKQKHGSLVDLYKNCKVSVLASTYETCGMVNLEAGLAGCNVVTSDIPATKEYCKGFADYFDPNDLGDINQKVSLAYDKPTDFSFQHYISQNYTWDQYVDKHVEVYKQIL